MYETDIYELSNVASSIESTDDSIDLMFKEVVKFYKYQNSGKYLPKYCNIRIKQYDEYDNYIYIGPK